MAASRKTSSGQTKEKKDLNAHKNIMNQASLITAARTMYEGLDPRIRFAKTADFVAGSGAEQEQGGGGGGSSASSSMSSSSLSPSSGQATSFDPGVILQFRHNSAVAETWKAAEMGRGVKQLSKIHKGASVAHRLSTFAKERRVVRGTASASRFVLKTPVSSFVLLNVPGVEGMCALDGEISTLYYVWYSREANRVRKAKIPKGKDMVTAAEMLAGKKRPRTQPAAASGAGTDDPPDAAQGAEEDSTKRRRGPHQRDISTAVIAGAQLQHSDTSVQRRLRICQTYRKISDLCGLMIGRARSMAAQSREIKMGLALREVTMQYYQAYDMLPESLRLSDSRGSFGAGVSTIKRDRNDIAGLADAVVRESTIGKEVLLEFDATSLRQALPQDRQLLSIIAHFWGDYGPTWRCISLCPEVAGDGGTIARSVIRELRLKLGKGATVFGMVTDNASAMGTANDGLYLMLRRVDRRSPQDIKQKEGAPPVQCEVSGPVGLDELDCPQDGLPRVACLCHMLHRQVGTVTQGTLFDEFRVAFNAAFGSGENKLRSQLESQGISYPKMHFCETRWGRAYAAMEHMVEEDGSRLRKLRKLIDCEPKNAGVRPLYNMLHRVRMDRVDDVDVQIRLSEDECITELLTEMQALVQALRPVHMLLLQLEAREIDDYVLKAVDTTLQHLKGMTTDWWTTQLADKHISQVRPLDGVASYVATSATTLGNKLPKILTRITNYTDGRFITLDLINMKRSLKRDGRACVPSVESTGAADRGAWTQGRIVSLGYNVLEASRIRSGILTLRGWALPSADEPIQYWIELEQRVADYELAYAVASQRALEPSSSSVLSSADTAPRLEGRLSNRLVVREGDAAVPVLSLTEVNNIKLLIRAVRRVLVWPLSSAEAERTFSVVKAGADPRRASLGPCGRLLEARLRLDQSVSAEVLRTLLKTMEFCKHDPTKFRNVVRAAVASTGTAEWDAGLAAQIETEEDGDIAE